MMRQMRQNTKWIMLVTALAFVGLMVFEWGMDITGRSGLGVGEIGTVNGEGVSFDEYNASYRRLYDQIQNSQEEPVTSQQVSEIEDAAWDDVVNQLLIRQELRRRGIEVTDDEIRSAARFSPPPEFQSSPAFMTDGRFDLAKYQDYLSNPAIDESILLALEGYYRDVIPRGKLLRQVSSDVYVSDAALWQDFRDRNEQIEVRYMALDPAQRIADEDVAVTDAEIEAYYRANRETEFSIPEQASVRAIVLDKKPTAADSAAGEAIAAEYRQRLADGEVEWDAVTGEGGGAVTQDLGWFRETGMIDVVAEAAFATSAGQSTEPVLSPVGWHVVEVLDTDGDSIQGRQLLVRHERTDESELELLTQADSVEALGENRSLQESADNLGLEVQNAILGREFAFIGVAGQVGEGSDWAFEEAEVGDVSPVFETRTAFYMLELDEVREAGHLTLEDSHASIEQTLRAQKKLERAKDEAEEMAREIADGKRFEDVAVERDLEIRGAGPYARPDFVTGIGRMNAAVGAGFGLNEGEVSSVVEANNNAFLIQLVAYTPADSLAWVEQMEEQRAGMIAGLQQARLQEWLEGLRAAAEIVDRRDEVLNQDPSQQYQPTGLF